MKFTVQVPEKISLNQALRMGHNYRRFNNVKQEWWYVLQEKQLKPYTGSYPVDILYHFFLNGTQIDSTNCSFLMKSCEDAMVASGIIPGDSPKYVRWTAERSNKVLKGETPHVVVKICKADREW